MALGLTLLIGSIVMNVAIGALGLMLTILGAVGWFRNVLPAEKLENFEVATEEIKIAPESQIRVRRIEVDETHRAQLPLRSFSIWSGVKGGIAGGFAMIIVAEIYGIARYQSIWYIVNLLGGAGVGSWRSPTPDQLTHFRLSAFLTAGIIQIAATLLVGMLYGALLPVWPKRPVLLGGIVAPLLWTGLLHSILGIVNPYLAERIDWFSFAVAQVVFGLVAGFIVSRLGDFRSLNQAPLAVRLSVETPGLKRDTNRKEDPQ
ncbi:MAG TPA: hypothetical protein VGD64_15675 [Acidisarcina sp.]